MLAAAIAAIGADGHGASISSPTTSTPCGRCWTGPPADVDLIVTSGGVSAGAYEVVKDALTGQGIEFAKVAMQPGMPQGAGRYGGVPDRHAARQSGQFATSRSRCSCGRRSGRAMGHPDVTRPVRPRAADRARSTRRPASGSSAAVTWTPSPARSRPGAGRARTCCPGWPAPTACSSSPRTSPTWTPGDEVEVWLLG